MLLSRDKAIRLLAVRGFPVASGALACRRDNAQTAHCTGTSCGIELERAGEVVIRLRAPTGAGNIPMI